jgi:uncharacterized protein YrrD
MDVMQFRENASVRTPDGEKIGEVDRVVLDPQTKEVTHLVAEKGFLFTTEKVVPMNLVGRATEDEVTLSVNGLDFDSLPDFEESHYIAAEVQPRRRQPPKTTTVRSLYSYPPVDDPHQGANAYGVPEYVKTVTRNVPKGSVALQIGANVYDPNGEQMGEVEQVMMDGQAGRATHLLLSEGLFMKERKLIPTTWITHVQDNEVHLSVDSDFVDSLPEYASGE